ncbi:MAG: hypothetical protein SFT92_04190 [Rickettsiales bacterium]|nr:hypothetical protein [Rickettsiales bacterium]
MAYPIPAVPTEGEDFYADDRYYWEEGHRDTTKKRVAKRASWLATTALTGALAGHIIGGVTVPDDHLSWMAPDKDNTYALVDRPFTDVLKSEPDKKSYVAGYEMSKDVGRVAMQRTLAHGGPESESAGEIIQRYEHERQAELQYRKDTMTAWQDEVRDPYVHGQAAAGALVGAAAGFAATMRRRRLDKEERDKYGTVLL